ncbi:acyl carrier protein [Brevibacillus laterosporus]|uniref:Acyl carrier protein n=1 Tax=Brevibacillus laterosporus TaxID=1465 RepID=A0AAP3DCW3_BRELA|nr:acyl carrier protein [Brevibacillus laterosporus]MCR8978416.1 acyl carrier protein [Brevibacillus laterosporus]MCZ0805571.1 acyl carrier protein [Brevibacillus laterosporus]MCZ0825293.1 acyl carrier protein [Brevibacillus laterosporus]MCZ0849069.1 acyl carrier protein [Brevibacillus laterosporus]MED1663360.1 acyl carrier protein [Brevibacillus laterosporus]
MNREDILKLIIQHTCEIIQDLEDHDFQPSDKLVDLGANSVDRAEIVMMTMESVSLKVPRVSLAGATNIGELADVIFENLQSQ